jgi:hypothetical protein
MACSKCKQKNKEEIKQELIKQTESINKAGAIITVVWIFLGFYGLYHLIRLFI